MKPLSQAEITKALAKLPDWHPQDDVIVADFSFKDFFQAFSFMIKVATAAEKSQHHPDWSNVYNRVHIELSTHEAGGITQKDLDLAKTISELK